MFRSISVCPVEAGSTDQKSVSVCVGLWLLENQIVFEAIKQLIEDEEKPKKKIGYIKVRSGQIRKKATGKIENRLRYQNCRKLKNWMASR